MRVRYGAVVVLGASGPGANPSSALIRRARHGIDLFLQGRADFLILSGGAPRGTIPEAQTMRALALAAGVPESAIVVEDRSHRTLENVAFTAPLMAERNCRTALIVSDPFHLPRALYVFRKAGIAAVGSPARNFWREVAWWRWPFLCGREIAAFILYVGLLRAGMPKAG